MKRKIRNSELHSVRQVGMIFKDGVPMRKVAGVDIVEEFVKEVEILRKEGKEAKSLNEQSKLVHD